MTPDTVLLSYNPDFDSPNPREFDTNSLNPFTMFSPPDDESVLWHTHTAPSVTPSPHQYRPDIFRHNFPLSFQITSDHDDFVPINDPNILFANKFDRTVFNSLSYYPARKQGGLPKTCVIMLHGDETNDSNVNVMFETISEGYIFPTLNHEIDAQLNKLSSLEDGWLDGEGLAPPHQGIVWLASVLARHYRTNVPSPYLYPTEEGNIQVEWSLGEREITLEINLMTHSGYWHELRLDTDHESDCELDINSTDDWSWIAKRIEASE